MRIAAALCWYDEEPETLARCVRSVAPLVDSLVAYDGAWEGFPHWRPFSGFKPMLAIRDAHEGKRAGRIATLPGLSIVNRTHSRCAARLEAKREYGKARAHRGID